MTKIVAIVQARMGSTRLPGKVLMDLAGEPLLIRELTRIHRSERIDEIVVATTKKLEDDPIIKICEQFDFSTCRGNELDVLDRYYQCAKQYDADIIVRLTGDCPLIDPGIIDATIDAFLIKYPHIDYACNFLPQRTFPRGLDVEVIGKSALHTSWWDEMNLNLREHVTQHILRNPDAFTTNGITNEIDLSEMRWTVDTIEDFRFVHAIYSHFKNNKFTWKDVLDHVTKYPELQEINKNIKQKEVI